VGKGERLLRTWPKGMAEVVGMLASDAGGLSTERERT
jgi:hypothetical protein